MNNDIGLKFKMIDEALARRANAQLQKVGLTFSQANVMGALFQQDGCRTTQHNLETMLGVTHPTVVGLVKRLEAKGFVTSYFSAEDARMKIVQLTDKGKSAIEDGSTQRCETELWLTENLTSREADQLDNLLGKVLRGLDR